MSNRERGGNGQREEGGSKREGGKGQREKQGGSRAINKTTDLQE